MTENFNVKHFSVQLISRNLKSSETQIIDDLRLFDVHNIFTKEVYDKMCKTDEERDMILAHLLHQMISINKI